MNKIKNFLIKFMYGRYGVDTIYWWCLGAVLVLWLVRTVLSFFDLDLVVWILSGISTAILVYAMFRFLSKNRYKRSAENRAFRRFIGIIGSKITLFRSKFRDRKTHVYKKCPKCKAVLRLPKKKGKHTVCCPKCRNRFDVKI